VACVHRHGVIPDTTDAELWNATAGGLEFQLFASILKGMTMKAIIALSLVVTAVALGACRREEAAPEPMKLGGPAVSQPAR
jgi:hypothetical protein